jgi:predicted alpha/beta superfamily hydrolase
MQVHSSFWKVALLFLIFSGFFKSNKTFGQKITLKSAYLKEERIVNVHLPDYYDASKTNYPVIYVFDGAVVSDYVAALFNYDDSDMYPQAIIVGVHQKERSKELVPFEKEKKIHENFLNFVNKELLPKIDASYRTNNLNMLIGHSFGGYFSLVCMLENPKIKYAISISPVIFGKYEKNIDLILKEYAAVQQRKIYFGIAEYENKTLKKGVEKLNAFIKKTPILKIESSLELYRNEDHNSSILIGARRGLQKLFENWPTVFPEEKWDALHQKKDPTLFYKFFDEISKKTKKTIIPSEEDYNSLGYYYLSANKISEAIEIFKKNIYLYPYSSNGYDSLGEAYEKNSEYKKALKFYKKAIKIEKKTINYRGAIEQYTKRVQELRKIIH